MGCVSGKSTIRVFVDYESANTRPGQSIKLLNTNRSSVVSYKVIISPIDDPENYSIYGYGYCNTD